MGPCLLFSITATKCTRESKLRKKGLPWLKSSVPSLWARGKAECKGSGSVRHVTSHTQLLLLFLLVRWGIFLKGHCHIRSRCILELCPNLWLFCAPIPGRVGVFASYLHSRRAEASLQLSDSFSCSVGYRVY